LPAKVCAQPSQQNGEVDRFDQVVVCAGVQSNEDIDLVAARGQADDQQVGLLGSKDACHLDAVDVR
jgi:hypothetical protein